LRDGGSYDECHGPEDEVDEHPEDPTAWGHKSRALAPAYDDSIVAQLLSDVAIQQSSDQASDDGNDVADGLFSIGRDTVVG
jgi:hypothetical protein